MPALPSPVLEPVSDHFAALLPERTAVHLDAGSDSTTNRDLLDELGHRAVVSQQGYPLQAPSAGRRPPGGRVHPLPAHPQLRPPNRRSAPNATRVIDTLIALASAITTTPRPVRTAWTTHRWDTRPSRRP